MYKDKEFQDNVLRISTLLIAKEYKNTYYLNQHFE
jgi:hypothetical protein